MELDWSTGPVAYDADVIESERYEYSIAGGPGGILADRAWHVRVERKSDGRVFDKKWSGDIEKSDLRNFCQAFEDGYVVVFPWEWKKVIS